MAPTVWRLDRFDDGMIDDGDTVGTKIIELNDSEKTRASSTSFATSPI
jgi:hypothetical protein